ncbi:S1 family peptidase [Krasilnikovia sp. M28-CT-15]|uniref:S1 family peptidase n=1 Tax=Krasilnikovia sp. M28-CT-15 TaxID=3373540 RepID=UPI00387614E9
MQRRTVVAIAATLTAAGAAVAFTLPSMADTTASPGAAPRTTSRVAPQLLAAMKRDLGVDANRATAMVQRAKWASGVTAQLRTEAGSTWAGSWLTDGGMTLNVAVTDAQMAARARAAGASAKVVDRSAAQLDAAKKALDAAATRADRALPGWYVDVASNKIAVQALPGGAAQARDLAADAGLPADAVKVVTTRSRPKPLADVIGAQPYFISVAGGTARCSIGFAVEGGFVTAGHCGKRGDATADLNQQESGVTVASVFPGNADMGVVRVDNADTFQPFIDDFNGNALPVAGSSEAPVGAAVCRSGSTTGLHCGTILAKNQTVNYPEGAVTGLTRTDACAEGGDSGGPWLTGDQAQGVTSGGSGDCTVGGETFFQPVNEILQRNGVTLVTTGGAGGAAAPPAQGADNPPANGGAEQGGAQQGGDQQGGDQQGGDQQGGDQQGGAQQGDQQGDGQQAGDNGQQAGGQQAGDGQQQANATGRHRRHHRQNG